MRPDNATQRRFRKRGVSEAFIVGESINGTNETPLLVNLLCVALSGRTDHIHCPNWLKFEIWPREAGSFKVRYHRARFLGQKSFQNQLVFWDKKPTENKLIIWASNLLKITSIYWAEVYWKSACFLGHKPFDNQLVFWYRKPLKISSFSGLEIYWKSPQFLGQKSFKNQPEKWATFSWLSGLENELNSIDF